MSKERSEYFSAESTKMRRFKMISLIKNYGKKRNYLGYDIDEALTQQTIDMCKEIINGNYSMHSKKIAKKILKEIEEDVDK